MFSGHGARLGTGASLDSCVRWPRSAPYSSALDDAQWLDASSAEVLTFIVATGWTPRPVAVLATVRGRPIEVPLQLDPPLSRRSRPASDRGRSRWERSIGCSGAGSEWHCRRPLIIRQCTGAHRGEPVFSRSSWGRALVRGFRSRAEGRRRSSWPESLRAVVAQRLGGPCPPSRSGTRSPPVAALAATVDGTVWRRWEEPGVGGRRACTATGAWSSSTAKRVRFAHPLLAPACYEAMPLHRRRRLHLRLAELDCRSSRNAPAISRLRQPVLDEEVASCAGRRGSAGRRGARRRSGCG